MFVNATDAHQTNSHMLMWCQVVSLDESSAIGRISKQWTGFEAEAFTDADNFGLQFPMDLDVKIKAVLLGACFLIVSICTLH